MILSRRELAYRAIEGLLKARPYFQLAERNREIVLEECEVFPFALLIDGGETNPDHQTHAYLCHAELEIDVAVRTGHRDEVVSELNLARAEARNALAAWHALPEAGELLANVEYLGCFAPVLALGGAPRGVMTLNYTFIYQEHELDAYASG